MRRQLVKQYRAFVAAAPDELTVWARVPQGAAAAVPAGRMARQGGGGDRAVYAGDIAAGERAIAPLRRFGRPVGEHLGADAVRRLAAGVRSAAHARGAELLEVARLHGDQRRRRSTSIQQFVAEAAVAAVRDLHRAPRRRGRPRGRRCNGVSAAATPSSSSTSIRAGSSRPTTPAASAGRVSSSTPWRRTRLGSVYVNFMPDDEGGPRAGGVRRQLRRALPPSRRNTIRRTCSG